MNARDVFNLSAAMIHRISSSPKSSYCDRLNQHTMSNTHVASNCNRYSKYNYTQDTYSMLVRVLFALIKSAMAMARSSLEII